MSQQLWKPSSRGEENSVLLIGPSPHIYLREEALHKQESQHLSCFQTFGGNTKQVRWPQAAKNIHHHHHHQWRSGYMRGKIMENKTRKNALSTKNKQHSAVFLPLLTQSWVFTRTHTDPLVSETIGHPDPQICSRLKSDEDHCDLHPSPPSDTSIFRDYKNTIVFFPLHAGHSAAARWNSGQRLG